MLKHIRQNERHRHLIFTIQYIIYFTIHSSYGAQQQLIKNENEINTSKLDVEFTNPSYYNNGTDI